MRELLLTFLYWVATQLDPGRKLALDEFDAKRTLVERQTTARVLELQALEKKRDDLGQQIEALNREIQSSRDFITALDAKLSEVEDEKQQKLTDVRNASDADILRRDG